MTVRNAVRVFWWMKVNGMPRCPECGCGSFTWERELTETVLFQKDALGGARHDLRGE